MEVPVLNIRDSSGELLPTSSRFNVDLAPYASAVIETAGSGPNTIVCWATLDEDIDTTTNAGAVSLTAIFKQSIAGRPDFEASVPLEKLSPRRLSCSSIIRPGMLLA